MAGYILEAVTSARTDPNQSTKYKVQFIKAYAQPCPSRHNYIYELTYYHNQNKYNSRNYFINSSLGSTKPVNYRIYDLISHVS